MLRLTSVNNPRLGQAFIDYMASRKIEVRMMPEGEGMFALWLMDPQHQVEVEAELDQFLADPLANKYRSASWDMAESRTQVFSYHSTDWLGMIKEKAGPFTLVVMVVSLCVFVMLQLGVNQSVFSLLHFPATQGQEWQIWRWVSHAVLHFSVIHIVFNLLWWWQLGGDLEQKLGSGKLLGLFLVSATLSGFGQYWVEGANFGGLSGVVYALVGYLWMYGYYAPKSGLGLSKAIVGFMLVWLVLGFVQPFMAIANTAHLVGLISGVVMGLVDAKKDNKKSG